MKMLVVALSLVTLGSAAQARVLPTPLRSAVVQSEQYQKLVVDYRKMGGSFDCSRFEEISRYEHKSLIHGFRMTSVNVVADCRANPNDGGDSIFTQALVTIVIHENVAGKTNEVVSFATVTPPQPD